ncbi:unannotated protein [freshwater metagenome]|uniref:Unannotated protein n=1 Tax=freshwater metagenome TaxID=449393 RepID=A0A6J7IBX7_9ZZZZ|nr:EamA family transporter [Actinomycetota bacterium]
MNFKIFALVISMISWGFSNPLADLAITKLPSVLFAFIVCGVGFLFLVAVALIRRRTPVIAWKYVIPLGIMQPGLAWYFASIGYTHENASTGVLILTSETLFTVLIGVFWLRDRLTPKQWLYFAVGILGVIIASSTSRHVETSSTAIYFLISALLFGVYANIMRRYVSGYSSIDLVLGQTFVSTLFFGFFYLVGGSVHLPAISANIWISAILCGVFGVGLPFVAFNFAVQAVPGKIIGPSLNIIPIAGVLTSLVLGRGAPTLTQLIGSLLVIASVSLISEKPTDRKISDQETTI